MRVTAARQRRAMKASGGVALAMAASLTTSGCALMSSYAAPTGAQTASFQLETHNVPTGALSRHVRAWAFEDESCKPSPHGSRLGSTSFTAEQTAAVTDPVQISANERFVVAGIFMDARFAQSRACYATVGFTPLAGHRYKALLTVSDTVSACRMDVVDGTASGDRRVDVSIPGHSCDIPDPLPISPPTRLNGQAVWTTFHVG